MEATMILLFILIGILIKVIYNQNKYIDKLERKIDRFYGTKNIDNL